MTRLLVALLLLVPALSSAAEFALPSCGAAEKWASDWSPSHRGQLTPAVQLPEKFRDAELIPLFGLAVLQWTGGQFDAAAARIGECADAADRRKETTLRDQLRGLQEALINARTPVRRIGLARNQVYAAVDALVATSTAPADLAIIDRAVQAVSGRQPMAVIPMGSAEQLRLIATIGGQQAYLLQQDVAVLTERLTSQRDQLQQQRRKAELAALAELEQARAVIDQVPATVAGLRELDRLQRHPALARAAPDDARAYSADLQAKRRTVLAAVEQSRRQDAAARLAAAERDLDALPLANESLATLDQMARLPALRDVSQQESGAFNYRIEVKRRQIIDALERARVERINATLAELQRELAALPPSQESRARLDNMARHPLLRELPRAQADAFVAAVIDKRRAIDQALQQAHDREAAKVAAAALAALQGPPNGRLRNLGRYRETAAATARRIELESSKAAAQRFWGGFNQRFATDATALLAQFEQQLEQLPATPEGLAKLRTAAADLTGVEHLTLLPREYSDAIERRADSMLSQAMSERCERRWKAMGIDADAAELAVWTGDPQDPDQPTRLGDLICAIADAGNELHDYAGPGLFSSTHRLRFSRTGAGLESLSLRAGEVRPGTEMLVGYQVEDASRSRPLTVTQWVDYLTRLTRAAPPPTGCDQKTTHELARVECEFEQLFGPTRDD